MGIKRKQTACLRHTSCIRSHSKYNPQLALGERDPSAYAPQLTCEGTFQFLGKSPQRTGRGGPPLEATEGGMG